MKENAPAVLLRASALPAGFMLRGHSAKSRCHLPSNPVVPNKPDPERGGKGGEARYFVGSVLCGLGTLWARYFVGSVHCGSRSSSTTPPAHQPEATSVNMFRNTQINVSVRVYVTRHRMLFSPLTCLGWPSLPTPQCVLPFHDGVVEEAADGTQKPHDVAC
jgi:hypothetical protein